MVVPVGKKVRVLTTANDVLHAWYVPALAVKQDAIPGFIRDTWFKALNHVSLMKPGIASCLTARAGTYQACKTSLAVVRTRTFLPTGTTTWLSTSKR